MPCPHNEISIVQRSQRQSAVAAAAYQSGEKRTDGICPSRRCPIGLYGRQSATYQPYTR